MLQVGKEKGEGNSDNMSEFISLCLQEVTLLSSGYFWPMRARTDACVFRVSVYTHTHTYKHITISLDGLSVAAPLIRQLDGWRHVVTKVCCHQWAGLLGVTYSSPVFLCNGAFDYISEGCLFFPVVIHESNFASSCA